MMYSFALKLYIVCLKNFHTNFGAYLPVQNRKEVHILVNIQPQILEQLHTLKFGNSHSF